MKAELYEPWKNVEAEFYNIKFKLYLGLFMPLFALAATLRSSLGLLHGRKRAHCELVSGASQQSPAAHSKDKGHLCVLRTNLHLKTDNSKGFFFYETCQKNL